MLHLHCANKFRWATPVLLGLIAVSVSWAGAVTGYVLPAYRIFSQQDTLFVRDGKMSSFWSDWDNGGTRDHLNMTPARNGWVDGTNSFSGSGDAELNIRAAYDHTALYLMFNIQDDIWITGQGYGMDNLDIILDKVSSKEIQTTSYPYDIYIEPSWYWTFTYYSVQYVMNVGSVNAMLPQRININYFSGSAISYNFVNLNQFPTDYPGWDLDIASIDSNTRQVEWKIPWTWVGCGGGLGSMPALGQMIAISGRYNDADTPNQVGRKSLAWKEKDPFNDCFDMVPPHAFCDAWGDILISRGMADETGFAILFPMAGDIWPAGTQKTIQWITPDSIATIPIMIELTTDGTTWKTISSPMSNSGVFEWLIPGGLNSNMCQIRISQVRISNPPVGPPTGDPIGISKPFTIYNSPSIIVYNLPFISVTTPNNSECWTVGSSQAITWTGNSLIGNVKIEFSTNTGTTWTTIATNAPNTGTYTWTIPNTVSHNCRVRISDATSGTPVDMSDSNFIIAPPIGVIRKETPVITAANSIHHDRISGTVTMNINLASAGTISAVIYGPDGRLIRQIDAGSASPGYHSIRWDGRNLQGQMVRNGCYQVKIRAGNATFIKPLIMAR